MGVAALTIGGDRGLYATHCADTSMLARFLILLDRPRRFKALYVRDGRIEYLDDQDGEYDYENDTSSVPASPESRASTEWHHPRPRGSELGADSTDLGMDSSNLKWKTVLRTGEYFNQVSGPRHGSQAVNEGQNSMQSQVA
jgi:hypothetical protein